MNLSPSESQVLSEIVTTLLSDRELVVFLGAGSSQEGRQGDHPYPSFSELIEQILHDAGVQPDSRADTLAVFQATIDRWQKERPSLSAALQNYLYGRPGYAHYLLAALSLSLYPSTRCLLYLTSNYDDLMIKAFREFEFFREDLKTVSLALPQKELGSEIQALFEAMEAHIRTGRPVVLKIFGDLDTQAPIFKTNEVTFQPEIESHLEALLRRPVLFIGYSFQDQIIVDALIRSRGRTPIFIVTPQEHIPETIARTNRTYHLKRTFLDFAVGLLSILTKRSPEIVQNVDSTLCLISPDRLYTSTTILRIQAGEASRVSLLRLRSSLPGSVDNDIARPLVVRSDSQPDIERFLQSDQPLLAIVGDSGTGKSTLLLQYYERLVKQSSACVVILYDVHHIQSKGTLSARIAQDFRSNEANIVDLLKAINNILEIDDHVLVILVDALNESSPASPATLKADIEYLASQFGKRIKLVYTCRKVYWNTYLVNDAPLPADLYFGAREVALGRFSRKESEAALNSYKRVFGFHGSYSSLSRELKDRICDPLMLRMLAEAYEGKTLPEFAPAVLIFDSYFEKLQKRYKGTRLVDFLDYLTTLRARGFRQRIQITTDLFLVSEYRGDPVLHNITALQSVSPKLVGDPWIRLEDEGILTALDTAGMVYKFRYDRFYEYLLGRAIGKELEPLKNGDLFLSIIAEISPSYSQHYSFLEALKSEVIRRTIRSGKKLAEMWSTSRLEALLYHSDPRVKTFFQDVVRELIFEGAGDMLPLIEAISRPKPEIRMLVLDMVSGSPSSIPVLIQCLLSGQRPLLRRAFFHLSHEVNDSEFRAVFEDGLFWAVAQQEVAAPVLRGLLYYSAVVVGLEDRLGRDPFPAVLCLWHRLTVDVWTGFKLLPLLANELAELARQEGPHFLSAEARETPIDYMWKDFGEDERAVALELADALCKSKQTLTTREREIVLFFGSELKFWKSRQQPERNEVYGYPFEFRIAEWLLISRAEEDFAEVLSVLEEFVLTGYWLSIDFALCNLEFILRHGHVTSLALSEGFDAMVRWTRVFRETQREKFFATLRSKDPFSVNYIPIAQLATIDLRYNTPPDGTISVIVDELNSGDHDRALLALLSTRYLWRAHPRETLATLSLFAQNEDPVIVDWTNRIFKEVFLVYPRLVEECFRQRQFSLDRIRAIKNRDDVRDASGFRYDGDALFKALFLRGIERRRRVAFWYKRLLSSGSFKAFFSDFLRSSAVRFAEQGDDSGLDA